MHVNIRTGRSQLYETESGGARQLLQLRQQRLRVDEVARVETFGEPGIDRRQKIARLGGSPLTSQELRETRRRPQLERLRLLVACDLDGSTKARLCIGDGIGAIRYRRLTIDQQRFPLEPMQLRFVKVL